ncbi:PepSY domain-containing protein [Butyricimonas paravirosa]
MDYEERANGSLVYIFEVEQGDREFDVTIDANNLKIVSAIPKN